MRVVHLRRDWKLVGMALYSHEEVSEATGLAVSTLRHYSSCHEANLVRDVDFVVRRLLVGGRYLRRYLRWTDRGLHRLLMQDYRVAKPSPARIRHNGPLPAPRSEP